MSTTDLEKLKQARRFGVGIGLLKGLGVTLKHLFKHNTVIQYPDVKQDLPARSRGVIALKEENCTVCMLCSRECPDWCIYIDSHKETLPPKREGGRPRKRNVLDRFAIDYALCMYCGICVEVCPYDALFWSREFEYSEYDIRQLTHEKEKLSDWMASVLPPPPLEVGALLPGQEDGAAAAKPAVPPAAAKPASTPQATVEASGARPPTTTSSAVETRPQQAEAAPKAGSAATEAARPAASVPTQERDQAAQKPTTETSEAPVEQPAVMADETKQTGAPAAPADTPKAAEPAAAATTSPSESETAAPGPNVQVPHEAPRPVALERTEDPEEVYRQVLEEQRAKGSSPQVAEARAKVARVKAERGIKRGPTPVHVEHPVPSAPVPGEEIPATPSGAPEAEAPQPEQGPVAPEEPEETGGSDG
ncbi:MAG: 4Fe-4S binding protein [Actinomycetota bacterium]